MADGGGFCLHYFWGQCGGGNNTKVGSLSIRFLYTPIINLNQYCSFRRLHQGAVVTPGVCNERHKIELLMSGKYSAICEKLSIQKVLHDDYSATGKCNFYYTTTGLFSQPWAMIFQVHYFIFRLHLH